MMTTIRTQIEANLRLHVDRLAGLIGPRCFQRPHSIVATIGYIRGEWKKMGFDVVDETYQALEYQATNLIVERKGTTRPQEIILLGAHYDTVSTTPGADDNASAVAVMLEVSRLLKDFEPSRTIRYVAFACEEPPFFNLRAMGSQHHARQCKLRDEKISAMLCLEMVGYFSDEPNSQTIPPGIPKMLTKLIPTQGNFLAAVGNLASTSLVWKFRRGFKRGTKLPLLAIPLPETIHEISLSDHRSFWLEGYPALMLTDTSFLRNPHYHETTDTPETLDYKRMTQVAEGVAEAMRSLAG